MQYDGQHIISGVRQFFSSYDDGDVQNSKNTNVTYHKQNPLKLAYYVLFNVLEKVYLHFFHNQLILP
jgi:hypothetical protein